MQLSAANEGVAAGKPMVLSHTQTLRSLFTGASVFVDPRDAASITNGVEDALGRRAQLEAGMRELRLRRDERWLKQAREVNAVIARAKQVRKAPEEPGWPSTSATDQTRGLMMSTRVSKQQRSVLIIVENLPVPLTAGYGLKRVR